MYSTSHSTMALPHTSSRIQPTPPDALSPPGRLSLPPSLPPHPVLCRIFVCHVKVQSRRQPVRGCTEVYRHVGTRPEFPRADCRLHRAGCHGWLSLSSSSPPPPPPPPPSSSALSCNGVGSLLLLLLLVGGLVFVASLNRDGLPHGVQNKGPCCLRLPIVRRCGWQNSEADVVMAYGRTRSDVVMAYGRTRRPM